MLKTIAISGALVIGAGLVSSCSTTADADLAATGDQAKCAAATALSGLGVANGSAK